MKRMFGFLAAAATVALGLLTTAPASADQLEEIKKKGVLVVGVKTDYPPWGMRDTAGAIVGMEPEMAADVAKRLGVKLELVSVVSSNRMQFLQQGKIDLMIATMSDTPERRKVVGIVDPVYYASGVAIMANKKANIKSAADLKGKPVCALQGAFYNNDLQPNTPVKTLLPSRASRRPSRRCSTAVAWASSMTTSCSSGRRLRKRSGTASTSSS